MSFNKENVENIYIKRESLLEFGWTGAASVERHQAEGPKSVMSPRYCHVVDKRRNHRASKQLVCTAKTSPIKMGTKRGNSLSALSPRMKTGFNIFSPRPHGGRQSHRDEQQLIDLLRKPRNLTPEKTKATSLGSEICSLDLLISLKSPRYEGQEEGARRKGREMSPLILPGTHGEQDHSDKLQDWSLDSASSGEPTLQQFKHQTGV